MKGHPRDTAAIDRDRMAWTPFRRIELDDIVRRAFRKRHLDFDNPLHRDSRMDVAVYARCDAIMAMVKRYPFLSAAVMGSVLRRDHTSVLHLMGRIGRKRGRDVVYRYLEVAWTPEGWRVVADHRPPMERPDDLGFRMWKARRDRDRRRYRRSTERAAA